MILATTIQDRLKPHFNNYFDFDVRYLDKWIMKYPDLFPKYMRQNKYEVKVVWINNFTEYRYEIHKIE